MYLILGGCAIGIAPSPGRTHLRARHTHAQRGSDHMPCRSGWLAGSSHRPSTHHIHEPLDGCRILRNCHLNSPPYQAAQVVAVVEEEVVAVAEVVAEGHLGASGMGTR